MKMLGRISIAALLLAGSLPQARASAGGAGTVSGLTLLEAPSARAYALGDSLVAGANDISVLGYNPAALATMKTGQASFLYQKGLVDDSYGHFMIGSPTRRGGLGLSLGYYDGGTLDIQSNGTTQSVTAQRDIALSLAAARQLGAVSIGATAKYLSSEIAQTAHASAYAADLGVSVAAARSLRLGAAVQNVGTQLRYVDEGDNLPRLASAGAALTFRPAGVATTFLVDGTYRMVERQFEPAVGLEVSVGVLALRAGFRGGASREITAGTGFYAGRGSLDYSFGVTSGDLNATHRISYSMRFGGAPSIAAQLAAAHPAPLGNVRIPMAMPGAAASVDKPLAAGGRSASLARGPVEITGTGVARRTPRTYQIKEGESLASIARDQYGDPRLWRSIYQANSHLIGDPADVKAGQKIVLP